MSNICGKKFLLLKPEKIMLPLFPIKSPFDEHSIKPLVDSIAANGIIEPLIIRKNRLGNFELVSGYRRLKAATTVGLRRVPCLLTDTDDLSAAIISVSENLNKAYLNYFEQAEMFKRISIRFGVDYNTIAEKAGISQSALLNRIKLLSIKGPVREMLLSFSLDEKYALIVSMLSEESQPEFIKEIVSMSLTPEKAKEAAKKYILPPLRNKSEHNKDLPAVKKSAVCDVRIFSNSLSKLINTLKSAGISAYSDAVEKEDYIEYTIRIPKVKQSVYSQTGMF